MLKLLTPILESKQELNSLLDELARDGAKKMLASALQLEVDEYIQNHKNIIDEYGHRKVVKNGYGKERTLSVGSGTFKISQPRVNDKREGQKFNSNILPRFIRKSPKVESLLPALYLKGLSTNKFNTVFKEFLGDKASGLSPSTIVKLKKKWSDEFLIWQHRKIEKNYVYIWVDGVNISVRLGEDKKLCLLVIIGVTEDGTKELVGLQSGYRESKESWQCLLRDLKKRGFRAPLLAIADGALGFWAALRDTGGFEKVKEQRCWVHKIANVLDKLPKRLQPEVKNLLHNMMNAKDKKSSEKERDYFIKNYKDKFEKATKCLEKDWDQLVSFFDFPAKQWIHLRTTNPIESSFATVKLRTKVTKGAGSKTTAEAMSFKLLKECEKKWFKIKGHREIKNLLNGVAYKDGIMIDSQEQNQKIVAS